MIMGEKLFRGIFWSAIEKFGTVFFAFLFNWILARYFLEPKDFGIIGMIQIFIAVANTTVIGGFGQALIQKEKPNIYDYNTVFYWNIFVSIFLYIVLFLCAPYISIFYSMNLTTLIRVSSLSILINALIIVQKNILIKSFNFKRLSIVYLFASIIGYSIGLFFAFMNLGVWCLVISTLVILFCQSLILWVISSWKPQLIFSIESFKSLFSFGGFMYLSNILETLYSNVSYLILGRFYTPAILGLFTQAEKLQSIPVMTLNTVIDQVTFPWFSSMQKETDRLKSKFIDNFKVVSFISFVLIGFLVLCGREIILLLFTEKWKESIPIFQLLCLTGLFTIIDLLNENLIKSVGRSKVYFTIRLIKRTLSIISLIVLAYYSVYHMLIGLIIASFIGYTISARVNGSFLGFGVIKQFKYLLLPLFIVLVSSICTLFFVKSMSVDRLFLVIIIKVVMYFFLVLVLCETFKLGGYKLLCRQLLIKKYR